MPRLYIHIPFCRKACVYCDFHFSTSLKMKGEMVEAICREIGARKDFFEKKTELESIYFGGGTPSVLSIEEISAVFAEISRHFPIAPHAEITLEANPDDLSGDYLAALSQSPINRLSIGIQSFDEGALRWMNRSHDARQAIEAVETARKRGFENLTGDLILGIPGQSQEAWEANLGQFVRWRLPHLSVYALSVEEKTALAYQVKTGKTKLAPDQLYERQFLQTHQVLTEAGYEHYELSNYALPGFRSRHNSSYWNFEPYLGIGPSAHSFDGKERSWNISNNAIYLKKIRAGLSPLAEKESLSTEDRYHEYLMTQLRKKEGISLTYIKEHFYPDWEKDFEIELAKWLGSGHLIKNKGFIRCTPGGWMVSDDIISDFF